MSSASSCGFFPPAPTATVETDLLLVKGSDREAYYGLSQKLLDRGWIPPYTVREGKKVFELEKDKLGPSEQPADKLTGRFQYVVYRDGEANNQIRMDLGSGAHYLVGRGRERAIIAGDIDFHEGRPIWMEDRSGTYHYLLEDSTKEKRAKIYAAQEAALRALKVPEQLIASLKRFIPMEEVRANSLEASLSKLGLG